MIVIADVIVQTGLQIFKASELIQIKEFGFQRSEEASIEALSRQFPLRDIALCYSMRVKGLPIFSHLVLPALIRVQMGLSLGLRHPNALVSIFLTMPKRGRFAVS